MPYRHDIITRDITEELLRSAVEYPVVTILGPRQSGKTTLARMTFPDMPYFSLEDPDVRMAAEADPQGFLSRMENGGVLDEVQWLPVLLSYIQGMVDKTRKRGRFILTGSHQPQLHEAISQSLAGRTGIRCASAEVLKFPMRKAVIIVQFPLRLHRWLA
jgi:predicted AAA+ superfamily ATPase